MHPIIEYEIAKARIADRQRQAEQAAIARAARRHRRALIPHGSYPAVGLARRIVAAVPARLWRAPDRSRRLPACQPLAPCSACA